MDKLVTPDPGLMFWTIVTFLALAALLKRFAWGPLLTAIEEREVHLKAALEERFQVPVHVNNDANCFALGEYHFGKGRGARSLLGMVVGGLLATVSGVVGAINAPASQIASQIEKISERTEEGKQAA